MARRQRDSNNGNGDGRCNGDTMATETMATAINGTMDGAMATQQWQWMAMAGTTAMAMDGTAADSNNGDG